MCHFWAQNTPICPEQHFLVQTIIITFIYLLALFNGHNLKKILQRIQGYEDMPFLGPKWSICLFFFFFFFFFFLKIINITLIYLLAPFIVQKKNFKKIKKILPAHPEL